MKYKLRLFSKLFLVTSLLFLGLETAEIFPARAVSPSDFLQTSGKDLIYRGQKVVLRGVNFDNIRALGAGIGTNNVNDIVYNAEDYQTLSSFGGNHARFGMSYSWYKQNKTLFFQKIDQQVALARANNIFLTLLVFTNPDGGDDCYEGYGNYCSIWTNTGYQNELKNFWLDVAARYKDEPAVVGYDLINEPTPPGPNWCSTWFTIAAAWRNQVAAVAPNQLIFIEACSDPTFPTTFKDSTGAKAKNVVYELHDYDPMSLTHPGYNASGTSATYPGNASVWTLQGTEKTLMFDKSTFAGTRYPNDYSFAKKYLVDWGTQNAVPIYIGEWGAQGWTTGFRQLIKDKAEIYTSLGVNHAYYTWRHDVNTGWRWGLFPGTGALVVQDQAKLDAVKVSLVNSVKPNFASTSSPSPVPSPSVVPSPTPSPTPSPAAETECKRSDINQDNAINLTDYSILISNFFKSPLLNARADINRDTQVNLVDFSIFVRYIFKSCTA